MVKSESTVRLDATVEDGDTVAKDIKHGKPMEAALGILAEYSLNTTIHGLRYIFEKDRHWTEKIWWAIAFVLSVYGCSSLILNVYEKWDTSPVIVSFAEKSTPLWAVPFPAVTVCPETKVDRSVMNFTDFRKRIRMANLTVPDGVSETDLNKFLALQEICIAESAVLMDKYDTSHVTELLREMALKVDSTMLMCKFRTHQMPCNDIFKPVMTEEGLCYTFNTLNSRDFYRVPIQEDYLGNRNDHDHPYWTPDENYRPTEKPIHSYPKTYPRRVLEPGARVGLQIMLSLLQKDLDYACRFPVQGFKFTMHTPGEFPQISKHYYRISLNQEVLITIKPVMITTSEGLRHYKPNRRQCFFDAERELKFFRVYTQKNCELECLTNFTVKSCGCARIGMPRDLSTPLCSLSDYDCYRRAENDLRSVEVMEGLAGNAEKQYCNCLSACTSITYDAEISQSNVDWKNAMLVDDTFNYSQGMTPSEIKIFFKEKLFSTSRRSELYGPTDFLANCGGLLGLFMGVSLLSIVEIIYYCTLRLFCNLRGRNRRDSPAAATVDRTPALDAPSEMTNL